MRTSRHAQQGETIRGELVSFNVRGQDYWGVGEVRTTQDGGFVKITGKLLGTKVGDTLELTGNWKVHERYGRQFTVNTCAVVVPQDAVGVIGWLAATLPQVSRRRAEALVERHGVEGTWRVLDGRDEAALVELDGITPARAAEIFDAYHQAKAGRDQVVRLKSFGLTDNQCAKVIKEWGADAERILSSNPYQLMAKVDGFGWARADQVAQRMGVPRTLPARIAAGLLHTMQESCFAGHCFVPSGKLVALAAGEKCLGVPEDAVRKGLQQLIEDEELVRLGARVYLPRIDRAEGELAREFAARAAAMKGAA
ncbi:MAG TPA: helix-hairpin-helix domain-containing protein [Burkholderiales bacterium]|nr:helix-hairpin-helix domain-containing protein [Burkholderiales bacterium]